MTTPKELDVEHGIILIGTDLSVREAGTPFTFKDAQAYVGGTVEVVRLYLSNDVLLVNEDGRALQLPRNQWASDIFGTSLFGNAVLLAGDSAKTAVLGSDE